MLLAYKGRGLEIYLKFSVTSSLKPLEALSSTGILNQQKIGASRLVVYRSYMQRLQKKDCIDLLDVYNVKFLNQWLWENLLFWESLELVCSWKIWLHPLILKYTDWCLFSCPSICLSIHLYLRLLSSVCLSIYIHVIWGLYVYPSIFTSYEVWLSVYLATFKSY